MAGNVEYPILIYLSIEIDSYDNKYRNITIINTYFLELPNFLFTNHFYDYLMNNFSNFIYNMI